jgi:acetyltransferase-like isoleucine patch superfamily enzyme
MKLWVKQRYKNINTRYPYVENLIKRVQNRIVDHTIRKKIYGHDNKIIYKDAILSSVIFDIIGDYNTIEIKKGSILNDVVFFIRGNNHRIGIDENCKFYRGSNIWFEDCECVLIIGPETTFENVHLALTEPGSRITIGRDCMFAYDIDVRTGDSHSIISQENGERINYAKDIYIGDHVWIAAHSILLKGSFIPQNSVVATGAVVTRKYEKKGIVIGGNPAMPIKEGITWSRERIYQAG